ncbi:MAG: HAMP domain-containing histidine kinase, partial [Lachnospiraceae bacterium]|nr:HAMP domain-containing histidine kinase [Lachnospiraceae bacterium]
MKQPFSGFIIAETLILITSLILLGVTAFSYKNRSVDVVMLNDYLQTVKEHFDKPDTLGDALPDADIMVISADGSIIYRSDEKIFEGIGSELDAVSSDMLCVSVTDDERFLGTLVMQSPAKAGYERVMKRVLVITGLIMFLTIAAHVSFLRYVSRNVIRPFKRLKEFAAKIAQGKLDEPLLMEQNNMFGLFTESFDIMREQLRESKNREIALKMKEKELVASLSHDLRSPVTGIRVICELLEVKVEDVYVRGKIENIRHKTEEMNALLSDLLSATLEDLGELNVNCSEVTSDILLLLVEEHDTRKKVISGQVPGCILFIDRTRLSQVIGNIIGNSYKYADTAIEVSYGYRDHYLEMTIRD